MINNLKLIRLQNNLTQQHLADVLGITRSAYSGYEIGRRDPDVETLYRLSKFYGLPMECFVETFDDFCLADNPYNSEAAIPAYLSKLSKEEIDLICSFRMMTKEEKYNLMQWIEKNK